MIRIVHYLNQFFAGEGGEDAASTPPGAVEGPVGPGRALAQMLGDGYETVATVYCGDDYAAGSAEALEEIISLVQRAAPDLLIAGPAFSSGRYGLICARLVHAARDAGIASLAAMHEDNPGVEELDGADCIASGPSARDMRSSLERLVPAIHKVARGESLSGEDGRVGKVRRAAVLSDRTAARRATDLVLARLAGDREASEIPLPRFDRVAPAPPVGDASEAIVALATEGALVPQGNPGRLESARATRWLRYELRGKDVLPPEEHLSVHGGFSTVWANEDPHRILPLDAARALEEEGLIGRLFDEYFVTAGNGTSVANARRFGVEWSAELRRAGVQAAILTST